MTWFDSEQGVEARSGHAPATILGGERRQPTRAQFCHAGAKQASLRRTNQGRRGII